MSERIVSMELEPYPDDMMWTITRSTASGLVHVLLTTAGVIHSAAINGSPVAFDHPTIAETVDGFDPPKRWVGMGALTGEVAVYDRALTPEEMRSHWQAWSA